MSLSVSSSGATGRRRLAGLAVEIRVARWNDWRVARYDPKGKSSASRPRPTYPIFGGPRPGVAHVTSASIGLPAGRAGTGGRQRAASSPLIRTSLARRERILPRRQAASDGFPPLPR